MTREATTKKERNNKTDSLKINERLKWQQQFLKTKSPC